MFVKVFAGAVLALGCGAFSALAQSTADIGGPRERPPAGYEGQQFVDSRGCIFLRAGLGGVVNWVPRVDRDRKPMCGYPPTFGTAQVTAVQEPAAEPVVKPAAKPAAVVKTAAEPPPEAYVPAPVVTAKPVEAKPAPVVAPKAVAMAEVVPPSGNGVMKVGCRASVPVPQRLRLTNGGSVIVCTKGDGTLEGIQAPVYPTGVGASLSAPLVPLGQHAGIGTGVAGARVAEPVTEVPKGYKAAWKDDRLNPLRGVGTAEGQAAQDQLWSRDLPAKVLAQAEVTVAAPTAPKAQVTASTMSAPAPAAVAGRIFVQVGSFGVPANAQGAAARLAALGLPVVQSSGAIKGRAVQVVLAGPFASVPEAQAALRAARAAGFADAFLR